jgi:hypothetical protein
MHQRPNPIHFFFQREMARVEKMELCTGNISLKEFSPLHRKDSIVFAPSDQRGGLLFTEILLPIGIESSAPSVNDIQGSLGRRHDIYPQAWESDCGTYEKTTESRARAERWEHPGDRLRDRRFPAPPR